MFAGSHGVYFNRSYYMFNRLPFQSPLEGDVTGERLPMDRLVLVRSYGVYLALVVAYWSPETVM